MTNQNNPLYKNTKMGDALADQNRTKPTNQNNELDHICTGGNWDNDKKRFVCEHEALYAPKSVTLKDIANPNMTPEADKVVSDALERSAETMDNAVKEAENIRLTRVKPVENGELAKRLLQMPLGKNKPLEFDLDELVKFIAQEKAKWVEQAAIMGAKFGNAAFRQQSIAEPGKAINLDKVRDSGIKQAVAWARENL